MNPDSKTIEQTKLADKTADKPIFSIKNRDKFEVVVVVIKNVGEIVYIALKFVEKYVF